MKKLLRIILFLTGLLLGAYGILLITLPLIGAKTQVMITDVTTPLPQLQDRFKERNLHIVSFVFDGEDGRTISGFSLRLSPPLGLTDIAGTADAFQIKRLPQLSALEDDAGISLMNGVMAAAGLLLALMMLPRKRRKAKARPKAASRPKPLRSTSRRQRYCMDCGQKLPQTAKFCVSCGARDPFGEEKASSAQTGQAAASLHSVQPTSGELQPMRTEGNGSPQPGDTVTPAKAANQVPASGDEQTARSSAHTSVRDRAPQKKGKAARIVRIVAILLLITGIGAGFFYRQQIVHTAVHLYFDNQWRFTAGKAEDEKGIRDMLDAAAKAFQSGDVAAACGYVFPPDAERIKALLTKRPGFMAAIAAYLGNVKGIRLGEAYTSSYGYSARPAEVIASFSGNEYSFQLLKIGDAWFISSL